MSSSITLRGPDVKIYINGQLFSAVTALRFAAATGRHAIIGIDQSTPFELAPGSQKISGSIEVLRIHNSGGLEGAGITAPSSQLLLEKYFSLTVVDRFSNSILLQVDEAAVIDQNWSMVARGLVSGSFTFEGIGWVNEADFS